MPYYWLSFADSDRPEGEQFLGSVIIEGKSFHDAVLTAWAKHLNPGGECWGGAIPVAYEAAFLAYGINRLMSQDELNARGYYSIHDRKVRPWRT